jgi:hypothetical protein
MCKHYSKGDQNDFFGCPRQFEVILSAYYVNGVELEWKLVELNRICVQFNLNFLGSSLFSLFQIFPDSKIYESL